MSQAAEPYEIVEAKNDLRRKVREVRKTSPGDDPVARAEAALKILSTHFEDWIADEIASIEKTHAAWTAGGCPDGELREAFFRAVHDLKGQATTLGFPLATRVAASLCALLEGIPKAEDLPLPLVDQHVKAVRAIYREKARDEKDRIGSALAETLGDVTRAYLAERGVFADG
jgi:chemotaxis protein histidine kinase CheA